MRRPTRSVLVGTATALLIGLTVGIGTQAANPPVLQQQPSLPLGHDDVREVQHQLIALGFDPGPADGQVGPATTSAAQQYDQSRGGTGRISIDSGLLARLKADTAPRLTYEQVAERSRARARPQASAPASVSASNAFGGIVQQIVPLIGAAIANSNTNRYGPGYYGYGPDPYYGPRYYAPPPRYYGRGYGFF